MSELYDIFLSHNGQDKTWAEKLAKAIEADKEGPPLRVFFDKWNILPGSDIPFELERGLQASRHVGLILSPKALKSEWVALERSTAIHRDPRAKSLRLIPLLRRDCIIPDMIARLKPIDFRRDQDFPKSLEELINVLRGRPPKRGGPSTPEEFQLREDAEILREHIVIFDRPAFRTPCIHDLSIEHLLSAIDDTIAAMNTGRLYSRNGRELGEFRAKSEYSSEIFRRSINQVSTHLTDLKREVLNFNIAFKTAYPKYSSWIFFYFVRYIITGETKESDLMTANDIINGMDTIDRIRNDILSELNTLLAISGQQGFDYIELSSTILNKGRAITILNKECIGGNDRAIRSTGIRLRQVKGLIVATIVMFIVSVLMLVMLGV